MDGDFDVLEFLDDLDGKVQDELKSMPVVEDVGDDLDLDRLAVDARRWARVDQIVAVVADLKGSTRLSTGKQRAASTASIYEAAIRPLVDTFVKFDADDLAIQGDGAIGIFWGDRRIERAMCAGITIKTFSKRSLAKRLEAKWPGVTAVQTGFKVGVAASRILVKKVGVPRTEHKEEVWAGKAVNYAAKSAQIVDRHDLIVTDTVWRANEDNDYIVYTCGCPDGVPKDSLWEGKTIDKIPEGDPDRSGRLLTSMWCTKHGSEYCSAILDGETKRTDVRNQDRESRADALRADSLLIKAWQDRNRKRALGRIRTRR